jgi:hypothetical protein
VMSARLAQSGELAPSLDFHRTEFASHDVPCKHHFSGISFRNRRNLLCKLVR